MSEERLIQIENKLDNHDKDIHSVAESLKEISSQIKRTNDIIQNIALNEEKFNARIDLFDAKATARFEKVEQTAGRAHKRIDKIENDRGWLVKLILGFIALGLLEAYVRFSPMVTG